jgi:hypothetical protein
VEAASVTPKSHDLWFEVPQQLTYLGRFYHFMEDPIKKLHKIDGLMDAVYCHLRDYEFREESKRKQEAIGKNHAVKLQTQQVTQSRKQKIAETTLLKRQDKKIVLTIIKKERHSLSGNLTNNDVNKTADCDRFWSARNFGYFFSHVDCT